jgi:hypothetical protein
MMVASALETLPIDKAAPMHRIANNINKRNKCNFFINRNIQGSKIYKC